MRKIALFSLLFVALATGVSYAYMLTETAGGYSDQGRIMLESGGCLLLQSDLAIASQTGPPVWDFHMKRWYGRKKKK